MSAGYVVQKSNIEGVDIDTPYSLEPAMLGSFERNGFVRLPQVLSASTIATFEPEITTKVIELNRMHLPLHERSTYGKAFLQITNLWQHSELVKQFVHSTRLARVAADLLGVDGVRLYHDQALYKEAGGGITPWHADQYYWALSTDRTCTVWVPLQDTPDEMGPLEFAVGSHRFEFCRDLPISDDSEAALQVALRDEGFRTSAEPYALGDVSYHLGWTFHRASPNRTETPRRVMTIIYMDANITVKEPDNDHQRRGLGKRMPGMQPGEIPDTPLNPVLYTRDR